MTRDSGNGVPWKQGTNWIYICMLLFQYIHVFLIKFFYSVYFKDFSFFSFLLLFPFLKSSFVKKVIYKPRNVTHIFGQSNPQKIKTESVIIENTI